MDSYIRLKSHVELCIPLPIYLNDAYGHVPYRMKRYDLPEGRYHSFGKQFGTFASATFLAPGRDFAVGLELPTKMLSFSVVFLVKKHGWVPRRGQSAMAMSINRLGQYRPLVLSVCCGANQSELGFHTSSTAQDGGGSFKNRKPIGEVGCCESRMVEQRH